MVTLDWQRSVGGSRLVTSRRPEVLIHSQSVIEIRTVTIGSAWDEKNAGDSTKTSTTRVRLAQVHGSVSTKTSTTRVRLAQVHGSVSTKTSTTRVHLAQVQGSVSTKTKYNEVGDDDGRDLKAGDDDDVFVFKRYTTKVAHRQ
ncbi:hypothetical protein Btru_064553 [Bulinus truncatus]|nr:hypothetical protein Btru_064553 [Bulinus truncatus]